MENDGIAHLTFSALRQCPQDLRRYDKNGRHGRLRSIQTTRQAVVADYQPWLEKAAHGRQVGFSKQRSATLIGEPQATFVFGLSGARNVLCITQQHRAIVSLILYWPE